MRHRSAFADSPRFDEKPFSEGARDGASAVFFGDLAITLDAEPGHRIPAGPRLEDERELGREEGERVEVFDGDHGDQCQRVVDGIFSRLIGIVQIDVNNGGESFVERE